MNRLQLATLISWAPNEAFDGRKRLQKVVFLLQHAGCQLDCKFCLHHYGPYSRDVAEACDEMVAAGLINELGGPSEGKPYIYALQPSTRGLLRGQARNLETMAEFRQLGASLIEENLWSLELGSTILHFYQQLQDWNAALAGACQFKKVEASLPTSREALELAMRIESQSKKR